MTTTGGSIGVSLGGKPKITNVGFNQDSRDKQGITRNTVVGDVEITKAEGNPINRDLGKANEVTKDTHSSTNINVEPQVIEYISNPAKFKEDLEVAILEGKATGETVLKSIENIVNGGKEDIGDPERRAINEIKEAVIRVKTAPQMESIAKAKDLNSPDVLKELDIAAIEKYDPYDPNLPIKVRQRVEKTLKDGKIPGVFYDEITNKIFVYKGMENDLEIRAGIAREWKISEDLKDEKGKPNEEGRLKATVAGELAYDDMMKRGREGKTESISTDRFADAVMDVNSEVTADDLLKDIKKGLTDTAKWIKNTPVYKEGEKIVKNPIGYSVSVGKQVVNEIGYRSIQGWNEVNKIGASKEKKEQLDRNTQNAKADRNRRNKEAVAQEEKERQQTERRKKEDKKQQKKEQEKREQEKRDKEGIEAQENKYKGIRTVDKDTYDYLSDLLKDPEKRYLLHDYSIELLKEENGRYTILEKLGDSRTKATQDYLAMKYTRGSKKEVTNSWTLEEVRKEIDQGKAVSSTRLLFITGYGINKETADKNADKKLEMFGEGAGQTITGTGRTLIGGKAVIVGLATCAETAGVGCGWAGIGLGNVTHGGNDAITGMQKVGHALSDSGYPIKGNVGAEYSRLKKGKGPSVSAENQYRIYNPGVSLIKAIGGTEDDYNVLNMYMGMALPYAAEYVENFSSRNTVKENKPERADSGNKKEINTELHQKINNREEGHYYKLQQQKNIESTGLPNYSIKPLTDIKDPALNVDKVRSYLQENSVDYIKGKYNVEDISVATAKVTTKDGKVENILSVSGRAWNGNAPKEVTIDNVKYKVIIKDSESVKTYTGISQNGNKVWNLNHAEKKLASYIQDNYSGKEVKVDIGVQNTSIKNSGMCTNCNSSMFDFAKDNPDMRITIYEGTTGINP